MHIGSDGYQLIHLQEALDLLGVSRSTLDRWRSSKGLPFVKIGKEVLFDRSALLEWMRGFSQSSTPSRSPDPSFYHDGHGGFGLCPARSSVNPEFTSQSGGERHMTIKIGYQIGTAHMWTPVLMRELGLFEEELRNLHHRRNYRVQWMNAANGLELVEGMIAGTVDLASLGDYPLVVSQQLSMLLPQFRAVLLAFDGKTANGAGISVVVPKDNNRSSRILAINDHHAVSTVQDSSASCRLHKLLAGNAQFTSKPIGVRVCGIVSIACFPIRQWQVPCGSLMSVLFNIWVQASRCKNNSQALII